jgi:hypothetical protein
VNEEVLVPLRAVAPQTNKQTPSDQHADHIVPNKCNYFRMLGYLVSTNSKKFQVTIRLMQFRTEDWNLKEVLI